MEHNSAPNGQHPEFPNHYNHKIFRWRRNELQWSYPVITARCGLHKNTLRQVFRGLAGNKTAFKVAQVLGLDWAMVHELDLPEEKYNRAVLNGAHLIAPTTVVSNSR